MNTPRTEKDRKYIKMSQVTAQPMTRHEYNETVGFSLDPENQDTEENIPGFMVSTEYDGQKISIWADANEFKECCTPQDKCGFGHAMIMCRLGYKVARAPWGTFDYLVFLRDRQCLVMNEKFNGKIPKASKPWICKCLFDNTFEPYVPTQEDMVADDWLVVYDIVTDWKKLGLPKGEGWWQ